MSMNQSDYIAALRKALENFYDGQCHCAETTVKPCVQCVARAALALPVPGEKADAGTETMVLDRFKDMGYVGLVDRYCERYGAKP